MAKDLPTQWDKDEKELEYAKIGTYVFAGFLALAAAVSLFGLFSYGGYGVIMVPFGLLGVISTALFAYANYRSAKAIGQRVDPHLSYFVSGMNVMAFPFGTILSWYTWSVLSRESVQELYKQGIPALPPAGEKKKKAQVSKKSKIVSEPVPEMMWQDAVAHVDEAEEKLWAEIEARAKGQTKEAGAKESHTKDGDEAAAGSIKLVTGDE
jgi:hypothetical protein